jgi:hypothetical protein
MKLLLDENLPHDLRHLLVGHEVFTVAYMGWKSLENGNLLSAAAASHFDAMLTRDLGVPFQQHLPALPLAVVVIQSRTNKLDDIAPLLPAILNGLTTLTPRTILRVP